MREAIKQMKPNSFDDIIALVALYRPGPMSNIPIYNDCKNGLKEPDYIPDFKSHTKINLWNNNYQEQVMQIAQNSCRLYCRTSRYFERKQWERKKLS